MTEHEIQICSRNNISCEKQAHIVAALVILLGIALAYTVYPMWIWLSIFFALGIILSTITGSCALGNILSMAPWNKSGEKHDS